MKFVDDFQAWIKGDKSAGYEKHRKDAIRDGLSFSIEMSSVFGG
jgi:hypothetical protein